MKNEHFSIFCSQLKKERNFKKKEKREEMKEKKYL